MITYQALIEPAEEGGFIITFPDFACGATQAETDQEALEMAADLLRCLVSDSVSRGDPLPGPKHRRGNKYREITLPLLQSVKAELHQAFLVSGMRKADLARQLSISKGNVDRLFDLNHRTRLDQLEAAFAAVGKRLGMFVEAA